MARTQYTRKTAWHATQAHTASRGPEVGCVPGESRSSRPSGGGSLEETHAPSTATGAVAPFALDSLPGVTFTLLHSSASPPSPNGDCAYRINNASIVLMMEINGIRVLLTGDANGKERDHEAEGNAGHIERLLLDLEAAHPGTLQADVLKAPHHGSETASTEEFINAVNPEFVIISASTMHHLPRETVVERYTDGERVILRTDRRLEKHNDHVICAGTAGGVVDCNYKSVLEGN